MLTRRVLTAIPTPIRKPPRASRPPPPPPPPRRTEGPPPHLTVPDLKAGTAHVGMTSLITNVILAPLAHHHPSPGVAEHDATQHARQAHQTVPLPTMTPAPGHQPPLPNPPHAVVTATIITHHRRSTHSRSSSTRSSRRPSSRRTRSHRSRSHYRHSRYSHHRHFHHSHHGEVASTAPIPKKIRRAIERGGALPQTRPRGRSSTNTHPCQVDIQLTHRLTALQKLGVAASTRRTYQAGVRSYLTFCTGYGINPLPASELTLRYFCTELSATVSHATLKVYLAGVRLLHIEQFFPDPLRDVPLLHYLCTGIR